MSPVLRQLVAACTILALMPGAAALCAGWQATAEARLDCCASSACAAEHVGSARGDNSNAVTQAEADDCCAAAESRQPTSSQSPGPVAATIGPVITYLIIPAAPLPAIPDADSSVPSPIADHVSRHVLLAVFLL